jgi:beta-lactamase regulating signal transducer with metallopeptidase domain
MNFPTWQSWAQALLQLAVQVTLWLVMGIMLVAWTGRRSPRAASEVSTWVLGGVLLLTVLAASPWPSWHCFPALGDEPHLAPPLLSAVEPQPTPVPPASLSWQFGDIDPPELPLSAIPSPSPAPSIGGTDRSEAVSPPSAVGWSQLVALLATVLSVGCLLRFGVALWAIRECRRRSQPIRDEALQQLCETLRRAIGIRRAVELRELPGLATPATLGWRSPVILLPADWLGWNRAEKTSVLAHELAHIRRGDYAGWLLAQLSRALHAYQPLLLVLLRWLRRDQELAADALAASFAGGPTHYTQVLCRLALRRDDVAHPGLVRAFLPAHLSVTMRVQTLLSRNRRSEPMLTAKWRVSLAVVLAAACLTVAGLRRPVLAEQVANPVPEPPSAGLAVKSAPSSSRTARERDIERRLCEPISLDWNDVPLQQALDSLRDSAGIPIVVDRVALSEAKVRLDQPVSMKVEHITVKSALNVLLKDARLAWVIRDEVVQVTTPPARGKLVQVTYPVADLVIPIPDYGIAFTDNGTPPAPPGAGDRKPKTDEERLIRLLVSTIEPGTWSEAGGPGTAEYFPLSLALVINQTPEVHEKISEVLDALRRLQELEVTAEIRFVSVSAAMARQLKRDFDVDCLDETTPRTTFLKAGQMEKCLEATQGDRGTNVLQVPRVTLFNGQNASIFCEEFLPSATGVELRRDGEKVQMKPKFESFPVGFRIGVQPVVSADRRSVRLRIRARLSNLDSSDRKTSALTIQATPHGGDAQSSSASQEVEKLSIISIMLERTISVPQGETAVLSGWKRSGVQKDQNGSDGEGRHRFLMVTPRLLLTSSEEAIPWSPASSGATADGSREKQVQVRSLLAKYQQACCERRFTEAQELAAEALKLDPGCFSKRR